MSRRLSQNSLFLTICRVRRMVYIFTAAYGLSIGPVAWVLPSEVFPLSARSTGVSISTASNWINNCKASNTAIDFTEITHQFSSDS